MVWCTRTKRKSGVSGAGYQCVCVCVSLCWQTSDDRWRRSWVSWVWLDKTRKTPKCYWSLAPRAGRLLGSHVIYSQICVNHHHHHHHLPYHHHQHHQHHHHQMSVFLKAYVRGFLRDLIVLANDCVGVILASSYISIFLTGSKLGHWRPGFWVKIF